MNGDKVRASDYFTTEEISWVKRAKEIYTWQWLKLKDEFGKVIFVEVNRDYQLLHGTS